MEELEALLTAGRSLDELQRVGRGELLYANFKLDVSPGGERGAGWWSGGDCGSLDPRRL